MKETNLVIRPATEEDADYILRVNRENVEFLAPMDRQKLAYFRKVTELLLIVEAGGLPVAFLIALREGVPDYNSENYRWFSKQYEKFLYVDRIVIDRGFRQNGIGRALYHYVKQYAENTEVPFITAEIDIEPYNEASLKFHSKMGFREVGTQYVRNGSIRVSLQEAKVE